MDNKSDPLALPPPEKLRAIAAKQDEQAKAVRARRARQRQGQQRFNEPGANERSDAAELIQRNYRGYRERRTL